MLFNRIISALTYPFFLRLIIGTLMFCGKLKRKKYFWLCSVMLLLGYILIAVNIFPFNPNSVVLTILAYFLWLLAILFWLVLCFEEPIQTLFFCCIAGYTTQQLSGTVRIFLHSVLSHFQIPWYPIQVSSSVAAWLISQSIHVIIFILVYFTLVRKMKTADLSLKSMQLITLSIFVLMIDIVLHAVAVEHSHRAEDFVYTTIIYAYNILSCLLIFYFQFGSLSQKQLQEEVLSLNELWAQQQKQYQLSKETIDSINIKCHDLKHQLPLPRQIDTSTLCTQHAPKMRLGA